MILIGMFDSPFVRRSRSARPQGVAIDGWWAGA
jgi:hypothetical protein